MRRSARSNVVSWLTSSGFGVRPFAPVNPTPFLFCAVRLAMRFSRLSDRIGAQNPQTVSYYPWLHLPRLRCAVTGVMPSQIGLSVSCTNKNALPGFPAGRFELIKLKSNEPVSLLRDTATFALARPDSRFPRD